MKKNLIPLLAILFMVGCKNANKPTEPKPSNTVTNVVNQAEKIINTNVAAVTPLIDKYAKIIGSFVGEFGSNKMTMLITNFKGDSVFGRSVVAMNDRPFKGTINYGNGAYTIAAAEPGDNKQDGIFNFSINENNLNSVSGKWDANDKSIKSKTFTFNKKAFQYNKNAGAFAQASQRLLQESDVNELNKDALSEMRNNIFARHGYVFYKKAIRDTYEKADWYVPYKIDVTGDLTKIEKTNIDLIKRFEKYADEYGDDFGR